MRYSTILLGAAAAAVASAQDSSAASSGDSGAATVTTTALTAVQSCTRSCDAGDVTCQAACLGVPHPGNQQMNDTTNCVADCVQGDGSASASEEYGRCVQGCISSYIVVSTLASVNPGERPTVGTVPAGVTVSTTAAAETTAASADASAASATDSSESSSASSAAAQSSNGASYNAVQVGSSVGGIAGLFIAILAL